ncbi:MAG: hypothetical protein IJT88_04240 [Kiritimatiellae bacterium]|nr:hypothetical protein [Kiritimatiellia bacterium]
MSTRSSSENFRTVTCWKFVCGTSRTVTLVMLESTPIVAYPFPFSSICQSFVTHTASPQPYPPPPPLDQLLLVTPPSVKLSQSFVATAASSAPLRASPSFGSAASPPSRASAPDAISGLLP